MKNCRQKGFTLIEIIILVSIIGVLGAVAIVKYVSLTREAEQANFKAVLGSLRSALTIYYGDNLAYPVDDLDSLVSSKKYLNNLPLLDLPGTNHPENRHVTLVTSSTSLTDTGGWAYINDSQSKEWGTVLINCTHQDSKEKNWNEQ